jgi:hypothetical protein
VMLVGCLCVFVCVCACTLLFCDLKGMACFD